ncbi:MAG TPA: hypothetical protein VMG12_33370, partial [Polyangiaceae bacterium]|nr:hypothetical protein [Polyangiaceae bacterium]
MRAAAFGVLWLGLGQALAAGCGDVTGDVIVRGEPAEGCTGDGDCADGQLCARPANVCVERCVDASSCSGERSVCDADSGSCRACRLDAECPAGAPRCLGSGACAECVEHADCGPGADADDDEDDDDDDDDALFCSAAGRCAECLDDGDCDDPGERCNTFIGECAEPCS